MPHSMGQPVLSDWADKPDDDPVFGLYKVCGFLNRDEAAILYQCAKQLGGYWLDIGAHTGWTTLHIAAGGCMVDAVEPMFANEVFRSRAIENIKRAGQGVRIRMYPQISRDFFRVNDSSTHEYDGVLIDGDHSWEHPLYDAVQSYKHLAETGVILLHDFIGGPVREAVKYLKAEGMKCRVYWSSSQLLACCWRGNFTPPDYTPDPSIDWEKRKLSMWAAKGPGDFYFEDCV